VQIKETHRIREQSDHQIYILLKEKEKTIREIEEKAKEVLSLEDQHQQETLILKNTIETLKVENEVKDKLLVGYNERFMNRQDEECQSEILELISVESQTDAIEMTTKSKVKFKKRRSDPSRSGNSSLLGITESCENESDTESSEEDSEEVEDQSHQRKKLKHAKQPATSSVITDPEKFKEERRKSLLRESIRNSVLFDKEYAPVQTTVRIFDNPEALKFFFERLQEEKSKFAVLKEHLQNEKILILKELQKFSDLFLAPRDLIVKEFQKKVTLMNDVNIANLLSRELEKVIETENENEMSVSPDPEITRSNDFLEEESKQDVTADVYPSQEIVLGQADTNKLNVSTTAPIKEAPLSQLRKGSIVSFAQLTSTLPSVPSSNTLVSQNSSTFIQQTKSEEQITKSLDLKALLKITKKLGSFALKKKRNKSGNAVESDSSEEENEEEGLNVDGFESPNTLNEMKKEKRKRKVQKPAILLEIDPDEKIKMEKKKSLRQFSQDRYFNAGTQTVEDYFAYSSRMPYTQPSPQKKRSAVISNSFLIRAITNPPENKSNSGGNLPFLMSKHMDHEGSDSDDHQQHTDSSSKLSNRLKSDTIFSDLLNAYYTKEQISQPFLGFVRKHEKIYAREIGLMKVALREYKRYYEQLFTEIQYLLYLNASNPTTVTILNHLLSSLHSNEWLFDPNLFIRKVNNNPLEDCVDVSTQLRIIESYQELLSKRLLMNHENKSLAQINSSLHEQQSDQLSVLSEHSQTHSKVPYSRTHGREEVLHSGEGISATDSVDDVTLTQESEFSSVKARKSKIELIKEHRDMLVKEFNPTDAQADARKQLQKQETLHQIINHNIKDLLVDLNNRLLKSGSWKALLYRSDGTIDVDMDHRHFSLEEQVQIQTAKVQYLHFKLKQKNENYENTISALQKINSESFSKITLLQKQVANHQHLNYNNNLEKLPYYRPELQRHAVTNDMGTNTDNTIGHPMKEIHEKEWIQISSVVASLGKRVNEIISKFSKKDSVVISRPEYEKLTLRLKALEDTDIRSANMKAFTRRKLSEGEPLSISDSVTKEHSNEVDQEEKYQIKESESQLLDEEFSKYSREIIDDYRLNTARNDSTEDVQVIVQTTAHDAIVSVRPYSASPRITSNSVKTPARKANKTLKPLNLEKEINLSPSKGLEFLTISGPKPLNIARTKPRPWSSTTWKQVESSTNILMPHSSRPKSPERADALLHEQQQSYQDQEGQHRVLHENEESKKLLRSLLHLSESLEKAFSMNQGPNLSREARRKPEEQNVVSQSGTPFETKRLQEKNVAINDHLFNPDNSNEEENRLIIGIGESALEENDLPDLSAGNQNAMIGADSASHPPEMDSCIFSPPSFHLETSSLLHGPAEGRLQQNTYQKEHSSLNHQLDGSELIYSKLYDQMFSALEEKEKREKAASPERKRFSSNIPINQQSLKEKIAASKSNISPEMIFYLSSVHKSYREHKEQSEKLHAILSNFEKSYTGVEFPPLNSHGFSSKVT
jgi:hypothetical protein